MSTIPDLGQTCGEVKLIKWVPNHTPTMCKRINFKKSKSIYGRNYKNQTENHPIRLESTRITINILNKHTFKKGKPRSYQKHLMVVIC